LEEQFSTSGDNKMRLQKFITRMVKAIFIINLITVSVFAGQGVVDTTFGTGGFRDAAVGATTTDMYDSVASGNKIWFTGRTYPTGSPQQHVLFGRYSSDGTLDFVNILSPCLLPVSGSIDDSYGNGITSQPDGKILITGVCSTFGPGGGFVDPFVMRFLANGSLDSTFGSGGIALYDLRLNPNCQSLMKGHDIAVALDGSIIVAGGEGRQNNSTTDCNQFVSSSFMMKTSPSGVKLAITYYPTFNTNNWFGPIAIQPDGKVVAGRTVQQGGPGPSFRVFRYNTDLTADATFGVGGIVIIPNSNPIANNLLVYSVLLDPDGKIVISGEIGVSTPPTIGMMARLLPNGTMDTTFNGTGQLLGFSSTTSTLNLYPNEIFRQPDGKYLVGGFYPNAEFAPGWGGFRVNQNGTFDSTYGTVGPGVSTFSQPAGRSVSAVRLADGSLFEIGYPSLPGSGGIFRVVKIRQNQNRNADRFDFDGDSKTDISIFRPSFGQWWYLRSSDGANRAFQFGSSTDKITPGDYTGDGKTDIGVWRPTTGQWFVLRSEDSTFYAFPFGANGDIPAPADYDGDGRTDAAVFRPSSATWFISNSNGGTTIQGFGASTDSPVPADYDGDAKADFAIFRQNGANKEWWYQKSTNNTVFATVFGTTGDKAVQGDYTGDGKTDIAVWRPSTGNWFILRSEDSTFYAFPFGVNSDIPATGDYDGDGRADAAVFRPSAATWFLNRSTAGTQIVGFGANGDQPVPNAFVP
jgi:uncharacterized delta-60 repeat protein